MDESRIKNALINSFFGIFSSTLLIILNLLIRVVIVRNLGYEFTGIHTYFLNFLSLITFIDFGFTTTFIILLYRPVKNNQYFQINFLYFKFKKYFFFISIFYFIVSLLFLLINILILNNQLFSSISNILYFFIFSLSFSISINDSFKKGIFSASLKSRYGEFVLVTSETISRILQIISILLFNNPIIFIIIFLFEKVLSFFITNFIINLKYPFLKSKKKRF